MFCRKSENESTFGGKTSAGGKVDDGSKGLYTEVSFDFSRLGTKSCNVARYSSKDRPVFVSAHTTPFISLRLRGLISRAFFKYSKLLFGSDVAARISQASSSPGLELMLRMPRNVHQTLHLYEPGARHGQVLMGSRKGHTEWVPASANYSNLHYE
jgi:hypothetical protein